MRRGARSDGEANIRKRYCPRRCRARSR